jgi:recombination protein RecA
MTISKDLIKKYGEDAFISGDNLVKHANPLVHVSPAIDLILGGGIPGGSIISLLGDPKCGKTLLSLHIAGKGQQLGREVYYLNIEGRLKPRDINGIQCLDASKMQIIRSYRNKAGQSKILKADEFLSIAEQIAHTRPGSIIIIDSISQLVTSGEMTNELNNKDRAPGATLMAKFCRRLSNVVPVNDIILIGVLHFIANTSGYGKAKVASGGNKIKYAVDIGLECRKFTLVREGGAEDGRVIGQEVEWITTSTAFAPPGQVGKSMITFGVGIDELYEMVSLAVELGLIQQSASWYKMSYMEDHVDAKKWNIKDYQEQGKPKLMQRLHANEQERTLLMQDFNAIIGASE